MSITPSRSITQMRRQTGTPAGLVTTLISAPESSISANLETRTSLRSILDGSPPAPTAVDCAVLNRLMKRFSGQQKVFDHEHYQAAQSRLPSHQIPLGPQPQHHHCQSKRKWEAAMQGWRNELRKLSLEADAAVVDCSSDSCSSGYTRLFTFGDAELETLNSIPIG